MNNVTRRSVAAGLAGVAATAAVTTANAGLDPVDQLWRQYMALVPVAKSLMADEAAAELKMPKWARSGPRFVCGDGSYCGIEVGWPLDLTVQPQGSPLQKILCRPGAADINVAFDREVARHPERRDWARANYRRHMRALVERLRARDAERARVGLPTINAAYERNYGQRFELRLKIERAPPSPNSVAALVLLGATYMSKGSAADNLPGLSVLNHVRPQLSGLVKEHVDQLLDSDAYTPVDGLPYFV